jgi:hypothetical protein
LNNIASKILPQVLTRLRQRLIGEVRAAGKDAAVAAATPLLRKAITS